MRLLVSFIVVRFLGLLFEWVKDMSSVGILGCKYCVGLEMMLVVVIVLIWMLGCWLSWCSRVGVRYWLMKVELFVLVSMMCRLGRESSGVRKVFRVGCLVCSCEKMVC